MPPTESEDADWECLYSGPNADVWMHKRCKKELKDLSSKDRAKILACMDKMYCQMERSDQIPPERLNRNEGRHGSRKLLVQAFKSFQARVYGVEGSIKGKRTFFACVGAVKKTDKADKADLEKAVRRVDTVEGTVAGAVV